MDLGSMEQPIKKPHRRECLPFAPSPLAVLPIEPPELSDGPPGGDRLDALQRANNLKVHPPTLSRGPEPPLVATSVGERRA